MNNRKKDKWNVRIAIVLAAALGYLLPDKYTLGPPWVVPAIEMAILIPLMLSGKLHEKIRQFEAISVISVASLSNCAALVLLVHRMLTSNGKITGTELFFSAIEIWITNVIIFGVWYWELDRGGPDKRTEEKEEEPDFLFPQMVTPECTKKSWKPMFFDYIYVSYTNATAFSPTDTMPLTAWAKILMMTQSAASLVTIAIVASRAVNILS